MTLPRLKSSLCRWLAAGLVAGSCLAQPVTEPDPAAADRAPFDQPATHRPSASGRVVASFDFEELYINALPVPTGWTRGQGDPVANRKRDGFPVWNAAVLDYSVAAPGGIGSVRLPTRGGSTSLILRSGVVPVFAGADYLINAMVRTEQVTHASAVLAVRLLDQTGAAIPGTRLASDPIQTDGRWQPINLELFGDAPDAAFLQIELLLLQPRQLAAADTTTRVWQQDFDAAAWFDDISVHQLPRVEISLSNPTGIVVAPAKPQLTVLVRDLAGQQLKVEASVYDLEGRELDSWSRTLDSGRLEANWTPNLDRLGWYRAILRVFAGDRLAGATSTDLVWLPAPKVFSPGLAAADGSIDLSALARDTTADRRRFSIALNTIDGPAATFIPPLTAAIGTGAVTVPIWTPSDTELDIPGRIIQLDALTDRLEGQGQTVTLAFDRLPTQLAAALLIDPSNPLAAFVADAPEVAGFVDPILDRFGQRIDRWQVGRPGDQLSFESTNLRPMFDRLGTIFGRLVTGPVLVVPWASDRPLDPSLLRPDFAAASRLTPGVTDQGIDQLAAEWAQVFAAARPSSKHNAAPPELLIELPALDHETFGRRAAASDLAKRMVEVWRAFEPADPSLSQGPVIQLRQPWTYSSGRSPRPEPTPEFAVWRVVADRLMGRRVTAQLDLAPGVRAYLLTPTGGGGTSAIVAWRHDAPTSQSHISLYLGQGRISAVDVFGNSTPVEPEMVGLPARPRHRIAISADPVFIEGVDANLVRFLESIRLTPGLIVSSTAEHRHELIIENPWPTGIRGRILVLGPGDDEPRAISRGRAWSISPRTIPFSVKPGQRASLPLELSFGPGEVTEPKDFTYEIDLFASTHYPPLRVVKPIDFGLLEVSLEVSIRRSGPDDPSGLGFIVIAEVTNLSDVPLSVELIAVAPTQSRRKAGITDLAPGETALRAFAYPGLADQLAGTTISVGLIAPEIKGRLNKPIVVPQLIGSHTAP